MPTWDQKVIIRQDAITYEAARLRCPKCNGSQIQIMNQAMQGAPFEWKCRNTKCRHQFTTGQQ